MKVKYHLIKKFIYLMPCIYIISCVFIIIFQYRYITNYEFEAMGENALNMSRMSVNMMSITSEQVKDLESMEFREILEHTCNKELEKLFVNNDKDGTVKYAYVIKKLTPEQVTYQVTDQDEAFYNLPIGTPLNYVWLLDVIVDQSEQQKVDGIRDYYKDKNRYTSVDAGIDALYENRKPGYLLWEDEWGVQISGLTPLYTVEGEYVGLLGIDMYSNRFFEYRNKILTSVLGLVVLPTVLLSFGYLFLHSRYRRQMSVLIYQDKLTGIFNRRYYDEEVKKMWKTALKQKKVITVILGDIDNFKLYNDKYGHQEGDKVLGFIANILQVNVPRGGFAARYGGEEFILVCYEQEVSALCERICTETAQRKIVHPDGSSSSITISLGACSETVNGEISPDLFLHTADQALYEAKASGKNTYRIKETLGVGNK